MEWHFAFHNCLQQATGQKGRYPWLTAHQSNCMSDNWVYTSLVPGPLLKNLFTNKNKKTTTN